MLCDVCHKNIATVHLTEIVNDKMVEMHICQKCAATKAEELKEQLSISDLLGGLVEVGLPAKEKVSLKCPTCGMKYEEFRKKGRFGCQNCYVTFKPHLLPFLKKIHGATRHIGKVPLALQGEVSLRQNIKELKEKLEQAIAKEAYEEAAALRDEIKKLEGKL